MSQFDDRDLPPTVASTPEPAPGSDSDFVGRVLGGRYRIVGKLGEGAMGAVYLGEHMKIGRRDAIKVLRQGLSTDPDTIARFIRGTRNVAMIRHPNICTIYDYSDLAGDVQFVAMEYVAGRTLRELLEEEGRLPVEVAVHITRQAADALNAAHEVGIVHRDLKPANIMVVKTRDGSYDVKVVDFDIAKGSADGEGEEVTRMGFVVGTPEYMSPEQLIGDKLDGRSDVYSLALVLFRMITGTLPFVAEDTQDLMVKRLTEQPMKLLDVMPGAGFPPALEAAIHRALQRKPADRQATAAEFGREVAAAVGLGAVHYAAPGFAGGTAGLAGASVTGGAGGAGGVGSGPPIAATPAATPTPHAAPTPIAPADGRGVAPQATPVGGAGGNRGLIYGGIGAAVAVAAIVGVMMTRNGGSPTGEPLTQTTAGLTASPSDLDSLAVVPTVVGEPEPAIASNEVTARAPASASSGNVAGSNAPPVASTSTPAVATSPLSDDAFYALLDRLGPPVPSRAALMGVRDTAISAWSHPAATPQQRAFAAYVAANALIPLGDTAQAINWLERSVQLRPGYAPYRDLLTSMLELYEDL